MLLEKRVDNSLANKVTSILLYFDNDRRSLMDMVSLIYGCLWNSTDVVDLFGAAGLVLQQAIQVAIKYYSAYIKSRHRTIRSIRMIIDSCRIDIFRTWGPFLERPGKLSSPVSPRKLFRCFSKLPLFSTPLILPVTCPVIYGRS